MAYGSASPRKVLVICIVVVLRVVLVLGLIASYEALTHEDTLHTYFVRLTAKKPDLATRAHLPDDMRATAQEATDDFARKDYDAAAACYQRILNKYPESLYAWSNLGVIRFTAGDLDGARTALEKCVAMAPDDAFSRTYLGMTYYQLSRYDEALAMLEEAISLDPGDAKSHDFLGCCLSQKGRQLDAEREFKKAIELDSHSSDAYFNLAVVLATAKPPDIVQARSYYLRALERGAAHNPKLEELLGTETHAP